MAINEMGCRGGCVRKEKEVWKRRQCLGKCKQFHTEGSLNCEGWGHMGRNQSREAGRNHTPEGHPPEPLEPLVPAFTSRREASAPSLHPRTLPVHWPFVPLPASGWAFWFTCPPRAHQSSLTLSINTSLSWCCWGAGSGCIPGRLAAPELCACSQASSPLGFCPCTASGLSSFLSDYFLYWEAPFRGLDPLNVGVGLASLLILSFSFYLLWAFPLILVVPVAFFKLMCIKNLSLLYYLVS